MVGLTPEDSLIIKPRAAMSTAPWDFVIFCNITFKGSNFVDSFPTNPGDCLQFVWFNSDFFGGFLIV